MTTNSTTTARPQNWSEPGQTGPSTGSPVTNEGATKEMFLKLLVAQIKHQNPLNPMDGVEFLGQLSQFTQVEQTLGVRQDLSQILAALKALGSPAAAASQSPGQ
jgi:flagellar basal-body rod modification protein FlgD